MPNNAEWDAGPIGDDDLPFSSAAAPATNAALYVGHLLHRQYMTTLEGRKEVCHARDSQNWLIRVKSSALVTGFVLAEGTHQTRCLFGQFYSI